MMGPATRMTCLTISAVAALGLGLAIPDTAVADLNDGLVAYWSFDEGSGNTVHDSSGHANHGTKHGASWVEGISGTALSFDGLDDYVDVPHNDSLNPAGSPWTVSVWVKTSADGVATHKARHSGDYYALKVEGGRAVFIFCCGGDSIAEACGTTDIQDGMWHHIAGVRPAHRTAMIYVDGFLEDTDVYQGGFSAIDTTLSQWIASDYAGNFLNSTIDEVRIYERALSEDEIRQLGWAAFPDQQEENTEGDQSETSGTSNDPVNTATGSFFHQETDLSIPSRGSPLIFTRFYNSRAAAPGRKAAK
ncbi:MAG: LamG domain-containing protein, partial [Phycisphaerae bacterium]|nr:LamG domain-containing protein [Phycisphaerae bacterium]